MRIVHIITGLPTAGAQMALYRLLSNINREKFESVVISLMDRGPVGEMIEQLGIPVYSLDMKRGVPGPMAIQQFLHLIRTMPVPDVLQGWEYHGNIASSIARYLLPGKHFVFWNIRHTPTKLSDEKRLTALIIRFGKLISSHVDSIIYNADISRSVHEGLGYEKSTGVVLYNGFDLIQFAPSEEIGRAVRMELGIAPTDPLVALIARFHPMKDHASFFHAAGLLMKKRPNAQFVLSGENVDVHNEYLGELITENGLSNNVHLLGERLDIPRLLTAIDILTVTSAWGEGFPNIVGEAMACGVPCIVTNIGDSAKIVGETGIVVPPQDPLSIFNALDKLLSMKSEQRCVLGIAARKRVEENYALTKMIKSYEDLYEKIGRAKSDHK